MLLVLMMCYTLYVFIKIYAAVKEIAFVDIARKNPAIILSADNYQKAAEYKIAMQKFSIVSSVYDFLFFVLWMSWGLGYLDTLITAESSMAHSLLFVGAFIGINYLFGLPFELYQTFSIDKKFGFSTIDVKTYLLDQLKASLMFIVFGGLFLWALFWVIGYFENWWLLGFSMMFIVILFINMIYPIFIVPMFNKLTPLEDEHLKDAIEGLLAKAGLKSSGVFSLDASKRDKRLNAYFGGLGASKRVVLFDTLIEKLSSNELLAVLGHELGHFKHKDIIKNIASSALMLFIMFALFGNLPQSLFDEMHLTYGAHMVVVMFLVLSPMVSFLLMPLFGILSRHNEYKADEYGSECESQEALRNALVKLADENKSFPLSHPLTIALYFTHPPLTERLKKLGMPFPENHESSLV